jgi:hypothetical protein
MLATVRPIVYYSLSKRWELIASPQSEEHRWTSDLF